MKILIYEDPKEHGQSIGTLLKNHLQVMYECELELVSNTLDADIQLSIHDFDFVIFHHTSSFDPVDSLKERHSKPKYAAYSGNIPRESRLIKDSLGEEYRKRMLEHYDFLLPELIIDLPGMLGRNPNLLD